MSGIDSITLRHLIDALKSLKNRMERSNALSYLEFRHELEKEAELGKDNSKYFAALDYIANKGGDMPLIDVINVFNNASNIKKK